MVASIIWGSLVAIVLLQVGHTEGRKKVLYMPCPGVGGNIKNVTISPCNSLGRRLFVQHGKIYDISVEFVSEQTSEITLIQPNLKGRVGRNWKKLPGLAKEILEEPLQTGDMYTFKMAFPVKKAYPTVRIFTRLNLLDQKNNKILCFMFAVQIVSTKKSNVSSKESCQLVKRRRRG